MELFVVNRHQDDEPDLPKDEEEKLNQTLSKIQRNKKLRNKQKEKEQKIKSAIERTTQARQNKREAKKRKANFVKVPDNTNDEFLGTEEFEENAEQRLTEELKTDVEVKEEKDALSDSKSAKKIKLDPSDVEGFTILGGDQFNKRTKVKRVLPKWLLNPTVISINLQKLETRVSDIKILDKHIRKLLKANGVEHFFPVQAEVIPWLIESSRQADIIFPRDICVSAPTGSGKTLAFVLPVVQAIKKYSIKKIRCLVILPTQDLARQVFSAFKTYSEGSAIDVGLVTGQNSFEVEQKQIVTKNEAFGYITKIDILVCTAGRLVDHLKMTDGFDLHSLEYLIIDEADRVLENVQNDWLYHLEKHIFPTGPPRILNQHTLEGHRPPQKLLFSATLSQDPEKLQQLSLFQPKLFTSIVESSEESGDSKFKVATDTFIGKYTTPNELTERYIETSVDLKPLVLYKFIKQEKLRKTLVFTHSVESAHRLTILLKAMFKNKIDIQEISSHLQPKSRAELISRFSNGKIDLLICTDALARGIDLPGVQCVISYSAPKYLKSYIHRAGRTARAGEKGLAVTFLHSSQLPKFKALLKDANKNNVEEIKISEEDLEPLEKNYKESLVKLKEAVEKEDKTDLKKTKSAKKFRPRLQVKSKLTTDKIL
ncbi:ATP-dependent RNA helicase DDX51 [Anthonomus grandis grandis]|uniref:ATP-dependent RNA helicase DDX51 n=1 Tax=Anthonomus grandis grandis TaxID=2921223 RepID=UPI00216521AE|nr:ATP-dependent RNA helicase DDX51 [Anthonomus grandis grandis]